MKITAAPLELLAKKALLEKKRNALFSEVIFENELNLTRPLRTVDLAVVGGASSVLSTVLLAKSKDRSVENICGIHAELELMPFGDREVLADAEVYLLEPGTVERAHLTITEGARVRLRDFGWIQEGISIVK